MSAVREVADYIERYFQNEYGMTLAELKQLAELKRDGKLIELPCKVGDTVYEINKMPCNNIGKTDISGFDCDSCIGYNHCWKGNYLISKSEFRIEKRNDFGEIVFLTKEEAEQALQHLTNQSNT